MTFNFKPNFKSIDGIFEVELNLKNLNNKEENSSKKWTVSPDLIKVYNILTDNLSHKTLYKSPKGLFFKGHGQKRYYIKDLKSLNA